MAPPVAFVYLFAFIVYRSFVHKQPAGRAYSLLKTVKKSVVTTVGPGGGGGEFNNRWQSPVIKHAYLQSERRKSVSTMLSQRRSHLISKPPAQQPLNFPPPSPLSATPLDRRERADLPEAHDEKRGRGPRQYPGRAGGGGAARGLVYWNSNLLIILFEWLVRFVEIMLLNRGILAQCILNTMD